MDMEFTREVEVEDSAETFYIVMYGKSEFRLRKAHSLIFEFINSTLRLPVKILRAFLIHKGLSSAKRDERAHGSERVRPGLVRLT